MKTKTTICPAASALLSTEHACREAIRKTDLEAARTHLSFIVQIAKHTTIPAIKAAAQRSVTTLGYRIAGAELHPKAECLLDIGRPSAEVTPLRGCGGVQCL